jgi:hypothetical protein
MNPESVLRQLGKRRMAKARRGMAIMAACAFLGLPCLCGWAAETTAGVPAVAWEQEIEADWLRQLARACEGNRTGRITPEMDAAGACDGVKDEETGFHTDRQRNP